LEGNCRASTSNTFYGSWENLAKNMIVKKACNLNDITTEYLIFFRSKANINIAVGPRFSNFSLQASGFKKTHKVVRVLSRPLGCKKGLTKNYCG
jgi:hypothetical protein